jgi:hypothetical protein
MGGGRYHGAGRYRNVSDVGGIAIMFDRTVDSAEAYPSKQRVGRCRNGLAVE